jgi:predicted Ser/Thr protein kinase
VSAVHPPTPGERFGPYRVDRWIGGGGMGDVYKAEDTRLDRPVALKFLREGSADGQGLQRLRIEARTASALNHPNICTIYEIGESEGVTFIAMEFLEGQSVREVLRRGALPPKRLLDVAIQAADALDAAHAKRIIHRDIKPENLFLLEGDRVKVLDFGLAKLQEPPSPSPEHESDSATRAHADLTQPGVVLGTPAYMSPEQIRGEELDSRTDLFSFGVVLFEMAAGRPAFEGRNWADISASVLGPPPALPPQLDPRLRGGLQQVLAKCLEKAREYRYQHASDLVADLKRLRRDLDAEEAATSAAAPRPLPPAPPPPGRQIVSDLLRAAAFAVLVLGVYSLVHRHPSGRYLDQFQIAFAQERVDHGPLDDADFQAGGRYLPLVIDISRLHPDKKQRTDRRMLDRLIDEVRRRGALAVGLDLVFDDLQAEDFEYLERWNANRNVRVGIYRRAVERKETWLGRPEFSALAAGIALPLDNPQQAFFYSRRWFAKGSPAAAAASAAIDCTSAAPEARCKEDLVQLPVALWLLAQRQRMAAEEVAGDAEIENRLKAALDDLESRSRTRAAGNALQFGEYGIDYSYLKEVRQDVITLAQDGNGDSDAAIAGLREHAARIGDRVVLVGDLEDTADHSCPTPSMKPVSGVLIHACSLATLNRGMVFQVTDALPWSTALVGGLLLLVVIVGLRALYTISAPLREWPFQYLEILAFGGLALGLFILFDWRVRARGFVWPHTLWLCGALAAHPFVSDPLFRTLASVGGIARAAASSLTGRGRRG